MEILFPWTNRVAEEMKDLFLIPGKSAIQKMNLAFFSNNPRYLILNVDGREKVMKTKLELKYCFI